MNTNLNRVSVAASALLALSSPVLAGSSQTGEHEGHALLASPAEVVITKAALAKATPSKQERGMIGVYLRGGAGAPAIDSVMKGGPAERAGLQVGDIIVAIGGMKIANVEELTKHIAGQAVGSEITLTVERDGWKKDLTFPLAPSASLNQSVGIQNLLTKVGQGSKGEHQAWVIKSAGSPGGGWHWMKGSPGENEVIEVEEVCEISAGDVSGEDCCSDANSPGDGTTGECGAEPTDPCEAPASGGCEKGEKEVCVEIESGWAGEPGEVGYSWTKTITSDGGNIDGIVKVHANMDGDGAAQCEEFVQLMTAHASKGDLKGSEGSCEWSNLEGGHKGRCSPNGTRSKGHGFPGAHHAKPHDGHGGPHGGQHANRHGGQHGGQHGRAHQGHGGGHGAWRAGPHGAHGSNELDRIREELRALRAELKDLRAAMYHGGR